MWQVGRLPAWQCLNPALTRLVMLLLPPQLLQRALRDCPAAGPAGGAGRGSEGAGLHTLRPQVSRDGTAVWQGLAHWLGLCAIMSGLMRTHCGCLHVLAPGGARDDSLLPACTHGCGRCALTRARDQMPPVAVLPALLPPPAGWLAGMASFPDCPLPPPCCCCCRLDNVMEHWVTSNPEAGKARLMVDAVPQFKVGVVAQHHTVHSVLPHWQQGTAVLTHIACSSHSTGWGHQEWLQTPHSAVTT